MARTGTLRAARENPKIPVPLNDIPGTRADRSELLAPGLYRSPATIQPERSVSDGNDPHLSDDDAQRLFEPSLQAGQELCGDGPVDCTVISGHGDAEYLPAGHLTAVRA